MIDFKTLSARAIVQGVKRKEFSAREAVESSLETIGREDESLHAFLSTRTDIALREAEAVDTRIARGEANKMPLAGVPVALKDNMVMRGESSTAGSKMLESYRGSYDATVVTKLRAAGAVVVGKTNLDEFAMGSSTENSAFGPTKNPHHHHWVPGGSSGGSAAAVAASMVPLAFGSDTGGSIRQPAAFCGVVGMKPTYGAVSRFGLIAMASSLDQIGPFAREVADAEMAFDAIRGLDPFDATSVAHDPAVVDAATARTFVIGYPREYFESIPDAAVREGLVRARTQLEAAGFSFREISLPHVRHALAVYYVVMPAEVSTNLARFDGVRYHGLPEVAASSRTIRELFERTRTAGFGEESRRRVLLGTFVLSAGHYDAYYTRATMVRELIRRDFEQAFKTVDVIFAPVTPTVPFKFGEKKHDPLSMYLADIFTTHANLTGLPALSVPVGRYVPGSGVPPVGFQLIGRKFRDHELFRIGAIYESHHAD